MTNKRYLLLIGLLIIVAMIATSHVALAKRCGSFNAKYPPNTSASTPPNDCNTQQAHCTPGLADNVISLSKQG